MNCKYAYLDGVSKTGDPVTEGSIPASVTAEQLFHAKMLSAVTAQLSVAHASGITDAGFAVSKTVNGYSQVFDDIVVNWSAYSGATAGVNRLALVETRAGTVINTADIKERLSLVNRGTITTASPVNNSANRPDTDCVAFFDGYSRVFLNIDGSSYRETEKSATGIAIRIPQNVHLFTYNPINSQFTSLLDGRVNHAITVRTNSAEYNSIISNGLWCKGEGPATADADTAFAFYIGISPVNLQHGWTSAPVVKTDADKTLLTDPRGQIKSEINGIFDIQVLNDDGTINEKARFGHLMLPGQKRKCIYNDKYKMSGSTINFTIAGSATGVLDFSDKQTTYAVVEAKSICPYEASVVRAEEKGTDGTIYRWFEKMCTVFKIAFQDPSSLKLLVNQNPGEKLDMPLVQAAEYLPVELQKTALIRIKGSKGIHIADGNGNTIIPGIGDNTDAADLTVKYFSWPDFVKILETGKLSFKISEGGYANANIAVFPDGVVSLKQSDSYLSEGGNVLDQSFSIFPDESVVISADEGVLDVAAVIGSMNSNGNFVIGNESRVSWVVESPPGTEIKTFETAFNDGYISWQLETGTEKGKQFLVKATVSRLVIDGEEYAGVVHQATSGIITVKAGTVQSIIVSPDQLTSPCDNTTTVNVTATFSDAYGNLANDDTPVYWDVDSLAQFTSTDAVTKNGQASATLKSGKTYGQKRIYVSADGHKDIVVPYNFRQIFSTISPTTADHVELDPLLMETVRVTASFSDATGNVVADNTPVKWSATDGFILSQENITTGGQAEAVISSAGGHIGKTSYVFASIPGNATYTTIEFKESAASISAQTLHLVVDNPVLAADETIDGELSIARDDGDPL